MNKFKKILFLLISVVAILSVFVLNTFAYSVSSPGASGYFEGVPPVVPSSSCRVEKTNGYSLTPTSFFINNVGNPAIYVGGSVENSVRSTVRYNQDTISLYSGNVIEYWFVSINDFDFTIDFGAILTSYNSLLPSGSIYSPTLYIGVTGGYYDLLNSSSLPFGDFLSMDYGSDLSVCSTYQVYDVENGEYGGRISYIDEGYTVRNNSDLLFEGGYGKTLNTISGHVTSSVDTDYIYNAVRVTVSCYGNYEPDNFPFTLFGYSMGDLPTYTLGDLNKRSTADIMNVVGDDKYNRGFAAGYDDGKSDGYTEGYEAGEDKGFADGLDQGTQSGYLAGYDNGYSIGYGEGRDVGYYEGLNNAVEELGIFNFIIVSVEAFLTAELFPGFSFGLLLTCIAGVSLFIWFLKIFAGG